MLLCKCYINSILSVLYLRFWFFCKFSLFFCGVIHFLLFSFLPYNWTIHSRNGVFTANVCYVLPCRHLSSRDMMDQQKADEDPQKREAGNKGSTREILLPFSGVRSYPSKMVLDANVCDRGCKRLRGRLQTFAGRVANVCVQNRKNRHGNPLSELGQVWTEEEHLQESFCGDSSYAFRPLVQAIVYAIVFPMKIYWFLRVRRGCNDIK